MGAERSQASEKYLSLKAAKFCHSKGQSYSTPSIKFWRWALASKVEISINL